MTVEELLKELREGKKVKFVESPEDYSRSFNGGDYEYRTVFAYSDGEFRRWYTTSADFPYCDLDGIFNPDCDRCTWAHRTSSRCYMPFTEQEVGEALAAELEWVENDPFRRGVWIED